MEPSQTPPPLSTTTVVNPATPTASQTATPPTPPATPPPVTGTVVNQVTPQSTASKELSGGARAGIGAAIGVGNMCCGPLCNTCPTIISSGIGIGLYFAWKKERPETAKTILMVTLITGGIALGIFAILFFFGLAGAVFDSLQSY